MVLSLTAMWDAPSEMIATGMMDFAFAIQPEVQLALVDIGNIIMETAQQNTWEVFRNPTGNLASSMTMDVIDWQSIEIDVNVPYARRREFGFKGADALGRVYDEEPEAYLQPAIDENQAYMRARMIEAYEDVFLRMGVTF